MLANFETDIMKDFYTHAARAGKALKDVADFQKRRCHSQVSKVKRVCARWLSGRQTSRLNPTTVTAMMPTAAART